MYDFTVHVRPIQSRSTVLYTQTKIYENSRSFHLYLVWLYQACSKEVGVYIISNDLRPFFHFSSVAAEIPFADNEILFRARRYAFKDSF